MILPAQLPNLVRTDAQNTGGGGAAARMADKSSDQRFSLMLDTKSTNGNGTDGGRVKRADRPGTREGGGQTRQKNMQEQDVTNEAALAQAAQPVSHQESATTAAGEQAQDAPITSALNASVPVVDILEGVGLLNISDEPSETGGIPAFALPEDNTAQTENAGSANGAETVGTAQAGLSDDALQNAAGDIQQISVTQSNPLENVSSAAVHVRHALNRHQPQPETVTTDEAATEVVQTVPVAEEQPQQEANPSGGDTRGQARGGIETRAAHTPSENRRVAHSDDGVFGARFAQQLTQPEAAAETPAVNSAAGIEQNVLTQAASNIQDMLAEGRSNLTIQMKPEFLGHLAIELSMGKDGLKALIRSDDAGVRALLGAEVEALTQSLKEKGITVEHVEIAQHEMADLAGQFFQDRNMSRQAFGGQAHGGRAAGIAGISGAGGPQAEAAALEAIYAFGEATPDMLGATVEFSA